MPRRVGLRAFNRRAIRRHRVLHVSEKGWGQHRAGTHMWMNAFALRSRKKWKTESGTNSMGPRRYAIWCMATATASETR